MDVGVATVNRYRDLLAGAFMVRVLPPWFENLGKRIVKSPKVYMRDSGVLHFLLGTRKYRRLSDASALRRELGGVRPGTDAARARRARGLILLPPSRGAELDLLLLRRGRRWGFEFKCTDAPRTTKSMHVVMKDLGLEHLWLLYPGDRAYPLTDGITALPLKNVGEIELEPDIVAERRD